MHSDTNCWQTLNCLQCRIMCVCKLVYWGSEMRCALSLQCVIHSTTYGKQVNIAKMVVLVLTDGVWSFSRCHDAGTFWASRKPWHTGTDNNRTYANKQENIVHCSLSMFKRINKIHIGWFLLQLLKSNFEEGPLNKLHTYMREYWNNYRIVYSNIWPINALRIHMISATEECHWCGYWGLPLHLALAYGFCQNKVLE